MKKVIGKLVAGILATVATVGLAACSNLNPPKKGEGVRAALYAPDGAPALAIAEMIAGDEEVDYHVVDASTIANYVTGETPTADLCVLPVTAASKLLGSGEKYAMLATVTHGNLYLLSHDEHLKISSASELSTLKGKTVGVIQMQNVPGLTFQSILKNAEISYVVGESAVENAVCLRAINDPAAQIPALGCDFYVAAEPLVSLKVQKTAGMPNALRVSGDLQTLYGGENGYPQAVLVVKNTFLNSHEDWVKSFVSRMQSSIASLNAATDVAPIISALSGVRTEGLTPAFNANNLTADVIAKCNVKYVSAADSKTAVNAYLESVKTVKADAVGTVADKFFYAD